MTNKFPLLKSNQKVRKNIRLITRAILNKFILLYTNNVPLTLNTYGRRAFSVAGPTVWNSLPDFIREPTFSADSFRRLLKTYLFARY